jgi:hypothetical protein
MMKSCHYCAQCEGNILRDRIVEGINRDETRRRLLGKKKLNLKTAIEICKLVYTNLQTEHFVYWTSKSRLFRGNLDVLCRCGLNHLPPFGRAEAGKMSYPDRDFGRTQPSQSGVHSTDIRRPNDVVIFLYEFH